MIHSFVARVQELKWNTSMGKSLYVIIPKPIRDAISLNKGDSIKVAFIKVEFEEVINSLLEDDEFGGVIPERTV